VDKQAPKSIKPEAEAYSNRAVMKAVISESIQHPTTLYPAAAAILSGLYMGLIDFSETGFAVAAGSALVSLVSFIFHYFVRGNKLAENYVRKLNAQRQVYKEQEVVNIEEMCRQASFFEGRDAARELKTAYNRLDYLLKGRLDKNRTRTAERFIVLAEETYTQGVQFLNKALILHQILSQIDAQTLQSELTVWEREAADLQRQKENTKTAGPEDAVSQSLQKKIESRRKFLSLFKERSEAKKQVLAQCDILETTLNSAYLQVVDLLDTEYYDRQDNVAKNLERAVEAARRVEDRLRRVSETQSADDAIYLQS